MRISAEMVKFRKGLDERNIPWTDDSFVMPLTRLARMMEVMPDMPRHLLDTTMYRTHFTRNGDDYSVIFGFGSYGGISPSGPGFDNDLLELMRNEEDPIGYLTAEQALEYIDRSGSNED